MLNQYESFGFKRIYCKGYHATYNPAKDYPTAKVAIVNNFTNSSYIEPSIDDSIAWINQGGWIGHLLPEGIISIDVENPLYIKQIKALLEEKNIDTWELNTPNGKQFIFKTDKDFSATINQQIKIGISVSYRVGGKSYVFLPPTLDRCWERCNKLSTLPTEFEPFDIYNKNDILNSIVEQMRFHYRFDEELLGNNHPFAINGNDIDFPFLVYLVKDIGLDKVAIINIFKRIFGNRYKPYQTNSVYERTISNKYKHRLKDIDDFIKQKLEPRGLNYLISLIKTLKGQKPTCKSLLLEHFQIKSWLIESFLGAQTISLFHGFQTADEKIAFGLSLGTYLLQEKRIKKIFIIDGDPLTSNVHFNKFLEKLELNKDLSVIPFNKISKNFFPSLEALLEENLHPNSLVIFNGFMNLMSPKYGYETQGINILLNIINNHSVILLETTPKKKAGKDKLASIIRDSHIIYDMEPCKKAFTLTNKSTHEGLINHILCNLNSKDYGLILTEESIAPSDINIIKTIEAKLIIEASIQSVLINIIKSKHHVGSTRAYGILVKYVDVLWSTSRGENNSAWYKIIKNNDKKVLVDFCFENYSNPPETQLTIGLSSNDLTPTYTNSCDSYLAIGLSSKLPIVENNPSKNYALKQPTIGLSCYPDLVKKESKESVSQTLIPRGLSSNWGYPIPYMHKNNGVELINIEDEREKRYDNQSIINLHQITNLNPHSPSFFHELKSYKKNLDDISTWIPKTVDVSLKTIYVEELFFITPDDIYVGLLIDDVFSTVWDTKMLKSVIEEEQPDIIIGNELSQNIIDTINDVNPSIQVIDISFVTNKFEEDTNLSKVDIETILIGEALSIDHESDKSYVLRKLQTLTNKYMDLYDYLTPLGLTLSDLSNTNAKQWHKIFCTHYGYTPSNDKKSKSKPKGKTKEDPQTLQFANPGIFNNVAQFDIDAYYPSLMLNFGLCGRKDKDRIGLQILKELLITRKALEQQVIQRADPKYLKLKIKIIKRFANELSGYLSAGFYGFNDLQAGKSLRLLGKNILTGLHRQIEACDGEVVKAHTDSITYIHSKPMQIFEMITENLEPLGLSIKLDYIDKRIDIKNVREYAVMDIDMVTPKVIVFTEEQEDEARQKSLVKLIMGDGPREITNSVPSANGNKPSRKLLVLAEKYDVDIFIDDENVNGILTPKSQQVLEKDIIEKQKYIKELGAKIPCCGHYSSKDCERRGCEFCDLIMFCK